MLHLIGKYYCNRHGTTAMFLMLLQGTMFYRFMLGATVKSKVLLLAKRATAMFYVLSSCKVVMLFLLAISSCCVHCYVLDDTAKSYRLLVSTRGHKNILAFTLMCMMLHLIAKYYCNRHDTTAMFLMLLQGTMFYRFMLGATDASGLFLGLLGTSAMWQFLLLGTMFYRFMLSATAKSKKLLLEARFIFKLLIAN
ncbi:hypothetical protein M0804_015010 [Polistes exclamans]|nr:hypothetical protein M0804_015010 [Polistes exclamans]